MTNRVRPCGSTGILSFGLCAKILLAFTLSKFTLYGLPLNYLNAIMSKVHKW